MTWLLPSVVATAVGTSVLLIAYLWLWFEEREKFLLTWALAWAFYLGRFIAAILALLYGKHPVIVFAQFGCTVLSAILLLHGLHLFIEKPVSRSWFLLTGAVTGWVLYAVTTHQSFLLLSMPVFVFSGLVFAATGIVTLRSRDLPLSGRSVVGWAFILWGLHKLDYPILRQVEWFAPWGFLIGAFLSLVVAVGIIIIYFGHAKEQLTKSEEKYRNLVANIPDVTWTGDSKGNTVFISPNIERVYGFTPEEILEKDRRPWLERIHPDDFNHVGDALSRLFEKQEPFDVEYRIQRKDGKWIWLHDRAMAAYEKDGVLVADGVFRDISEQKRAEEALKQSEARYRHIFTSAGIFISLYDREGTCLIMNPTVAGHFGGNPADFEGRSFERLHPRAGAEYAKRIREVIESGEPREYEDLVEFPKGPRWLLSDIRPVRAPGENVEAAQILSIDITDRKRSEDALRESEQRFSLAMDAAEEGLWDWNLASCEVYYSPGWGRILGYSVSELDKNYDFWRSRIHPNDLSHTTKILEDHVNGTRPFFEAEHRLRTKDGDWKWVLGKGRVVDRSSEGVPVRMVGTMLDITERKQAEKALRESEEKFRTIFEGAGDGIFGVDPKTRRAVVVSPSMCAISGHTQSELLQLGVEDIHPKDHMPHVLDQFLKLLRGKINITRDIPVLRKDGHIVYCDISVGFSRFGGREVFFGFFRDVTERRLAEQAVRESQARYQTLFERSTDAILIVQPGGTIIDANPACGDLLGASKEEIVGADILQFYQNPSDRDRLREEIGLRGFVKDFEWRIRQKTGAERHCLVTSTAWKDESGTIMAYLSIARDITDSKRLEEQLLQSQKMEAVGTLAGGIAHDFNNLLQVIHGYADMGLLDIGRDQAGYTELSEIKKAAKRAAELTQGLLTFSRRAEGQLRPVDLNRELVQISKMLERTIPKMIAIELNLADDLRNVKADPGQLQQAIMNMTVNARDAMPDGGRLVIETANVVLDDEFRNLHHGIEPGDYVLLAISDSGHGMEKDTQEKIFDPFFTTKEVGKGTGLGLSIVFGIVKSHGGTVECYSEPGEGSTFKVYFPAIKQAGRHEEGRPSGRPIGGTETILLVDDEEAVRRLGMKVLRRFGYSVLTASNGREALDVFREHKDQIALVILDLIMPVMGGRECLREIMKMDPAAKVLIASGYGADGQIDGTLKDGAKTSLRKPYEARRLLEVARKVLDEQDM